MSISAAEFEALQLQLIELKEGKYESQDREKKLQNEIKTLKEHVSSLENDLKKADPSGTSNKAFAALSGVIGTNKNKKTVALQSENDALSRNLELANQEHREQQEATMQMVKNLHTTNKALEEEIENHKKAAHEKDRKIELQEGQLRKLQIQLLQYESSADIHQSETGSTIKSSGENGSGGDGESEPRAEGTDGDGAENRDTGRFEEENARLRENVRLLSVELKALDAKLSTSDEGYRAQITDLEQQLTTSREKIKQDEIASARMESRLEETISKLQKDKEGVLAKMAEMEEQNKKDKASAERVDELKDQVADFEDRIAILKTSRDEYMEQAKKITAECESISHAKSALEAQLSELEAEAGLLRKVRDEHSVILGQFESTKNSVKNLEIALDRANAECAELAEVKKELERLRQDLEQVNTHAAALQAELEELKTENAALRAESEKVAPLEQELDGIKLAHLQAVTESNTHKEQYEAERQKLIDAESSLQDMSSKLAEANEHVTSLNSQVTILQTEKDDLTTEYKVEERKNQRMIKELKSELQKERGSVSRSVSQEQLSLSVPPSPIPASIRHDSPMMTPVPLTPPPSTTPRMTRQHAAEGISTPKLSRQQVEAVNALPLLTTSVANLELSPSTMEELMRRDLDTALTMVGKLGEDKWKLEEKARFLEENLALLNEDLVRKTQVIQYYVTKTKQTVTPEQLEKERANSTSSRRQSGIRGTLMRAGVHDQDLSVELLTKMEAVFEETMLKNIQIQKDMETMANETGGLHREVKALREDNKQLATENHHYKEQLVRLMSNPHV